MPDYSSLFPPLDLSADEDRLIDLYVRGGTSIDNLPYSEQFEDMVRNFLGVRDRVPDREEMRGVLLRLLNLRRRGLLPRPGPFSY